MASSRQLIDTLALLDQIQSGGRIVRNSYSYDMDIMMQAAGQFAMRRAGCFEVDDDNRFLYENLFRWLAGDPDCCCLSPSDRHTVIRADLSAGIYVAGPTGTGKTLAIQLLCDLARLYKPQIQHYDKVKPLVWNEFRADDIVEMFRRGEEPTWLPTAPILAIHDLGSEPPEAVNMGNRQNVVRQILERRADGCTMTIITSNFPMCHDMVKSIYGDRVQSRLMSMCNYFELGGPDRRRR